MKRFIEGEDSPVRIVDVFVDEIDLQSLGFRGADPAASAIFFGSWNDNVLSFSRTISSKRTGGGGAAPAVSPDRCWMATASLKYIPVGGLRFWNIFTMPMRIKSCISLSKALASSARMTSWLFRFDASGLGQMMNVGCKTLYISFNKLVKLYLVATRETTLDRFLRFGQNFF